MLKKEGMSMIETTIFNDIILNAILTIFPLLLYLLLAIYKDNISNKYNDFLLKVALISSLYLCLRFGTISDNNKIFLFCNIPIVLAFIKKKTYFGIILGIINILYYYFFIDEFLIINIIKYISYLIVYILALKKNLSTNSYILSTAVLQGFFLSFEYFFIESLATINDIVILLILVFTYYFITFSLVYIFKTIDKVQKLNNTIRILEKEKKIKDALFKLKHEIKNHLAVCKGYLEIIDLDKREKSEKYLNIMQDEINRSLNIMSDFIQFNKIKIKKEKLCVNTLLEDIYYSFKIVATTKKIKLKYRNEDNQFLFVNGDYDRLKQVLVNLIKNSFEAIEKDGKIELSQKGSSDFVEINIKDNGIGMDSETISKIKEMFYTTKEAGTGLGVSLSCEIIEAHEGYLEYSSEPNKGTNVKITLPILR